MRLQKVFPLLLSVALLSAFSTVTHAKVVLTAQQVGSDVVISGGGTMRFFSAPTATGPLISGVLPSVSAVKVGTNGPVDLYGDVLVSPVGGFGPGPGGTAIGVGDAFGVLPTNPGGLWGFGHIIVPTGHASGGAVNGSVTLAGETLGSLGLNLGTYEWRWAGITSVARHLEFVQGIIPTAATPAEVARTVYMIPEPHSDSLVLNVVPEPSTYITWGVMGLVGTGLYWKRRKK